MKKALTVTWQYGMIALLCVSMIFTVACSVDQVLESIDVALQTAANLSTAIGAVSPADAAALTILTGIGATGINAIKNAYDAYEKSKTASNLQNVVVAAQTIQSNLPAELAALRITSPQAVTKATAWVNLVSDTAAAVVTAVGATTGTAAKAAATLTPQALQARWQSEVCSGDTVCGGLVKVHTKHGKLL
jgi:hypothetical protein